MRRSLTMCLAALLAAGCGGAAEAPGGGAAGGEEASPFLNARAGVAFTGSAACASCHEDLYRSYQTHGMANSVYRLTPEHAVEDFSGVAVHHAPSGFYYRPYAEGGRYYQEEYRLGASGEKTHTLVREMKYVVGSGSAARTYLAEEGGRYYEMPLSWYTQEKRWDFSPGYHEQNGRFDRLVPERCIACHNSYPESVPFAEGKYASMPEGIGCERCHGPGALHVEARLAEEEAPDSIDYTIVNPKHLSFERRLDVCQQCHLQGGVMVPRDGRHPFDFRPSDPLSAHVALFSVARPETGEIGVISHADRMQRSPCFLGSRGSARPMDCLTCHDPHEGFRDEGPEYFNRSCLSCHAAGPLREAVPPEARAAHAPAANCISCHMPKVAAREAPHSSFTDHWIRVVEEQPETPPVAARAPVDPQPYFARDAQEASGPVYRGMAFVVYGRQQGDPAALRQGVEQLRAALPQAPEVGEGHFLLGFAQLQLGEPGAAVPALEEAVRRGPNVPERLNALAQAYEAVHRPPDDIEALYRRALEVQPALAEVRVNYGRFLESRARLDEAIEQYRLAAQERPWLETAHFNLGTAFLRRGDAARAEESLRQALALNPTYPDALGNMGILEAGRGRRAEALDFFGRALRAAPESPTALSNLGTFYLNEGDPARAVSFLERAVRADGRHLDGLVNLALAYYQLGDAGRAREYAARALQVDPASPGAREILGALGG